VVDEMVEGEEPHDDDHDSINEHGDHDRNGGYVHDHKEDDDMSLNSCVLSHCSVISIPSSIDLGSIGGGSCCSISAALGTAISVNQSRRDIPQTLEAALHVIDELQLQLNGHHDQQHHQHMMEALKRENEELVNDNQDLVQDNDEYEHIVEHAMDERRGLVEKLQLVTLEKDEMRDQVELQDTFSLIAKKSSDVVKDMTCQMKERVKNAVRDQELAEKRLAKLEQELDQTHVAAETLLLERNFLQQQVKKYKRHCKKCSCQPKLKMLPFEGSSVVNAKVEAAPKKTAVRRASLGANAAPTAPAGIGIKRRFCLTHAPVATTTPTGSSTDDTPRRWGGAGSCSLSVAKSMPLPQRTNHDHGNHEHGAAPVEWSFMVPIDAHEEETSNKDVCDLMEVLAVAGPRAGAGGVSNADDISALSGVTSCLSMPTFELETSRSNVSGTAGDGLNNHSMSTSTGLMNDETSFHTNIKNSTSGSKTLNTKANTTVGTTPSETSSSQMGTFLGPLINRVPARSMSMSFATPASGARIATVMIAKHLDEHTTLTVHPIRSAAKRRPSLFLTRRFSFSSIASAGATSMASAPVGGTYSTRPVNTGYRKWPTPQTSGTIEEEDEASQS
jgi:hypothetical protein